MPKKISYFILPALFLHFMLLLSISLSLKLEGPKTDFMPPLPTYIYREEKFNPLVTHQKMSLNQHRQEQISKLGIKKSASVTEQQSMSAERYSTKRGEQDVNLRLKATERMDKGLLNILTKTLAANLVYPKIAHDFRLKGNPVVGFFLSPNGEISEVTLLRGSGTNILDQAAIKCVKASSPIKKTEQFLKEVTPMAIRFIFD